MVGGGGPDRGKCTVEVVVDGVAQVEIRGTNATLRTLSGQPAQWRRFECSGSVPPNAANFRFTGVDGRGRQELVREPRNGGAAVVQIEDKDGGAEGYTFDITWGDSRGPEPRGPVTGGMPDRQYPNQPAYGDADRRQRPDEDRYRPGYRDSDYYRRYGRGFTVDQAVKVCQDSIMAQATRRFRGGEIHLDRTAIDDAPGRQDWVTGTLNVRRGPRGERYGFACSVNFDNGRVRSADLDLRPRPEDRREQ
jgi:hypothetical protein